MEVLELTTETFHSVVDSAPLPVVVDFWAEWCVPCKKVSPVLEEIAAEYGEKLAVAKVNVDSCPELAQEFQIMSIPTLLMFEAGQVVKKIVGAKSKTALLVEFGVD